jgi:hypothetical protein
MAPTIEPLGWALCLVGGLALGCGRLGYEEIAIDERDVGKADSGSDASIPPDVPVPDADPDEARPATDVVNSDSVDPDSADAVADAPDGERCSGDACATCTSDFECGCAFFAGHAYRFCAVARTWSDAETRCEGAGMRLTRVDDGAENTWIRATADGLGIGYAWLGIEDPTHTSLWQWVDGTVFWSGDQIGSPVGGLYSHWNAAHPMGTSIRACGGLLSGQYAGEWDDRSCTSILAYVCEAY